MQSDLQKLWDWSVTNYMFLNVDKCFVIHFLPNKNHCVSYVINGSTLPSSNVIKEFGLHVDNQLTFQGHRSYVKSKSYQTINLIFKSFHLKITIFTVLYIKYMYYRIFLCIISIFE